MITINNLEEMKKYYDEQLNTFVFDDDVEFTIDIEVESNIKALDIKAWNIKAYNIKAGDIYARDINANDIDAWNIKAQNIDALGINAQDIDYFAYCIAYYTFKCKSAKSSRDNSVCKCLDGKIEYIK
jgi:hypothetical protein